jgi:hypothetical protein
MFHWIHIYENPETSEVAAEFTTLLEARGHHPKSGAEIICNGTILATVKSFKWVGLQWVLTEAGKSWTEFPEESRPKLVNGCWLSRG